MRASKKARLKNSVRIVSRSPGETEDVGFELARSLSAPAVVLLRGALGTGKTTLTRGIARGLGVRDPDAVCSPSFTLVNLYQGASPIYHVDLYRLDGEKDVCSIGLDDFLGQEGVTVIEWSERLHFPLEQYTEVEIEDCGNDIRILHIASARFRKRREPQSKTRRWNKKQREG